ncbi:vWA domain-containing protein [Aliikangiella coralliicola]|uniref:VWA domain-containing protein n=1 Tax=Aliikangiella coralliicola TaxID=2592383 RepID=A0A545TSS9_9GAMM|nr:VWA domain-containing protein [Aliikangiella coralliicola]TQV80277.1 VWA domain-containing protein [Aliikangiella coralliicola]
MIQIAYPLVFLLIPLPLIIWLFTKSRQPQLSPIRTPLFAKWQAMQQAHSTTSSSFLKRLLVFLTWVALVTAAARIQWIDEPIELPVSGRDLLLSIDISGSMEEEDLKLAGRPANRLEVVKSIITQFIEKREGDRLGLVLFGENAYLQTPLTFDLTTVKHMLSETEIGLAGASRTAVGDGIGLAVKRLRERPEQNRVLILLTDGRNNSGELDPIEAAKLAQHAGVKIYTIGVGADEVIRRSLLFGTTKFNPSAELDEKTLKQVAQLTGGQYFRARSTNELAKIYDLLDQLEPVEDEPETYRPVQELYFYPGLAALILLMLPILFNLFSELLTSINKTSSKKSFVETPQSKRKNMTNVERSNAH